MDMCSVPRGLGWLGGPFCLRKTEDGEVTMCFYSATFQRQMLHNSKTCNTVIINILKRCPHKEKRRNTTLTYNTYIAIVNYVC